MKTAAVNHGFNINKIKNYGEKNELRTEVRNVKFPAMASNTNSKSTLNQSINRN